jgi:lon-related putative ATP-dependent protease
MIQELSPEKLRRTFDPDSLGIDTTENMKPLEGIIGQERAVSALKFGLDIQEIGFNIYVAGPPGIGKMTAVESFLEEIARQKPTPPDWCYVNNFEDPYQPKVCRLPAGRGHVLQQDLKGLIDQVRREIPKAFESEEYSSMRDEIVKELETQRAQVLEQLNEHVAKAGFSLQTTPYGVMIVPVLGGRPLTDSEFQALPAPAKEDLVHKRESLQNELKVSMKQVRDLERAAQSRIQDFDRQVALFVVSGLVEDLVDKYKDLQEIAEHLNAIQNDIIENIDTFRPGQLVAPPSDQEAPSQPNHYQKELPFRKYQINVLVDNSKQEGAPVVVELNPSHNTLFGRVEKETQYGTLLTDFTLIKGGSIHRANGGYLVLPVEDTLRNLLSWDGLKRTLRSKEIHIEELGELLGYIATKSLRPQPIPLDIKIVLVGGPTFYHLLYEYDEEFPELFKVKADFDIRMDLTDQNVHDFVSFLCTFCQKENLRHLDSSGVARLMEHALRLAADQEKMSTHFGALADVVYEAHYWALREDSANITAQHVQKALDEKIYRSNLTQKHIQEMIARGTILIETTGQTPGQLNGLSVIGLGDYMFGQPTRITATVGPGREGIIDIEREVEMGGPIHSKGVLILGGYLSHKYAQDKPLTLSARLVFEQSYEGVEGDSASSTELYSILSALSGLPIKQGTAVTGSVNQRGEVQAIGGVNQKIEGFYNVCKAKGLTGEQGVIIPMSNVKNLMLREEVVEAVRSNKFHIWTVETIDEGIQILTGVPAGDRSSDGKFPEGSVNYLVDRRLRELGECMKEFADEGEKQKRKSRVRSRKAR